MNTFTEIQNSPGNRGRGVFGGGGGSPAPYSSLIQYVNIATMGNTLNFGDLTQKKYLDGCSSSTRGIFGTGSPSGSPVADLDYITIASEGDSIEFGDLTQGSVFAGCLVSSSTRGIICESTNPTTNVISLAEISTIGNAVDFGDMTQGVRHVTSDFLHQQELLRWRNYRNPQNENYSEFQSVTIASKGNSINFGSLSVVTRWASRFTDGIRGIFLRWRNFKCC